VADPNILKAVVAKYQLRRTYFIANAHNEPYLCFFYTGKGDLLEKKSEAIRGGGTAPSSFESATDSTPHR